MDQIQPVNLSKVDLSAYQKHLADCLILTHDNKLYMQRRPDNWRNPGVVCLFGGHIEEGETPTQAVIREVEEETGGKIESSELIFIRAIAENSAALIHVYFWHDKGNTITGCYEAEPIYFNKIGEALAHPKMMDYAKWVLEECQQLGLV